MHTLKHTQTNLTPPQVMATTYAKEAEAEAAAAAAAAAATVFEDDVAGRASTDTVRVTLGDNAKKPGQL